MEAAVSHGWPVSQRHGFKRGRFLHFLLSNQVSGMPLPFLAYLRLKPVYKRASGAYWELQHGQKKSEHSTTIHTQTDAGEQTREKMHVSASFICGLLLLFNLQQFSAQPIRTALTGQTGLTGTDIDILKVSGQ